jgi:hypothetical protein
MTRKNILRRLERVQASLFPDSREVLKIVVTDPWGIIGEQELRPLGSRPTGNINWLDIGRTRTTPEFRREREHETLQRAAYR